VIHDCSKILDEHTEELKNALQHKKEKVSTSSVRMLDPATALSLFRRMTDEVGTIFHSSKLLREESTTIFGIYSYLMRAATQSLTPSIPNCNRFGFSRHIVFTMM
jgi:hypothetical protein